MSDLPNDTPYTAILDLNVYLLSLGLLLFSWKYMAVNMSVRKGVCTKLFVRVRRPARVGLMQSDTQLVKSSGD